MRSNIESWKNLHELGYFERHKYYRGIQQSGIEDVNTIESFVKLKPSDIVVVIGCGYGRESSIIAGFVDTVYGIDVSNTVINKARAFCPKNFVGVLAETYDEIIPDGIDIVYSTVTLQHVTRDIVKDYLVKLGKKLSGSMVLQFLEIENGEVDARIENYEPAVSWTLDEIKDAALPLRLVNNHENVRGKTWVHHWVHLMK